MFWRKSTLCPGDWVIYRMTKQSVHPGPRAKDIDPARHGDAYSYRVDKLWVVVDREADKVRVRTRRGKEHVVDVGNPNLRLAHWWERLLYRRRFPRVDSSVVAQQGGRHDR